ncbi:MAG: YqhA family protein [Thermomicrobiales bacterium]
MEDRSVASEHSSSAPAPARPSALEGLPADPSLMPDPRDQRPYRHMSRLVGAGRIWILIAILGVSISSVVMLIYALFVLIDTVIDAFWNHEVDVHGANNLAVSLIELTDIFLLGMVLYVVALGMYQLFIDRWIAVPSWMRVENLQQLKSHLISVIVVLMAVSFLADLVQYESGIDLFYEGISIALVAAALSGFSWITHKTHGSDHDAATPDASHDE